MLKFRMYLVAVFATLLAVAASAADVPYGTNLLQNTNPDGTTFDPWVKTDAGSGWAISDGKFCSSNEECVLTQTVNLKIMGLTTGQTDGLSMMAMVNYEIPWPGNKKCIAKVIITCKDSDGNNLSVQSLLDINRSNLEVSATLATKPFLLPEGTTQLVYEMHGHDQKYWSGQYGPRFWGMYVGFIDLTKTYTASAVAALGDSLVFSQTDGIKALDTLTVASKYSDVRIKSISSENSGVISSNQAICTGADMSINAEFYRKHSIIASASEYGTITIKKDMAFYGDTIVVSHTMNSDTVLFAGYTTTPDINWLNDSTFIMVDEDVTIGMEIYRKHSIVVSASEYGTITIKKDTAFCGDTITVSLALNTGFALGGYATTPDLRWLNDSTFIMVDEDVTIGIKASNIHDIPFCDDFENGNTQDQNIVGWLQQSEYGDESWTANSTWTADNRTPYSGGWNATLEYGEIDWLFTPVNLVKGERYVFSVYARQDGSDASYANISAKIGTAADKDSMKQVVLAETGVVDGDYQRLVGIFTADTGGVCWLGIRGYISWTDFLSIDSVCLKKAEIHKINIAENEYGTISVSEEAISGDTIVVNHAMNSGFAFVRFTSTSNLTWLTSSTFIMPDEDVTIGIEAMRANELPFYEGFENGNTQGQNIVGWLQQSEYGNNSWTANSTNIPYSGSWNATLCYGNTDWLFTPVNLVKGEMYVFSVYARRDGFGNTGFYTRISAKIGTAADQDSMKQVVLANTVVAYGDYQHIVGYFTADTGGVCWLGVRGYAGNYFGMDLSIDSVSLEKVKSRKVVAENNYGTISVKDSALYGDTITVSHTMNSDTVFFVGYTTTPDLSWVNDSTFIMPDEDVTIGMKVLKPQMPLREGFENGNTRGQNVVGWLHQSESEDNKCWIAVGTTPYSGSWDALLKYGTIAWIFTPVNLEKGVRYAFTIYSRTFDNAGANISAKIGTAADKDSMKYVVMAKTGVADGDYQRLDNFFTSDTSGVCWLGIRGYTHRFCDGLVIDSISFEKAVEHTITTKKEYGTIKVNKDNALFGDTITVSRRMNSGFAFVNYTTTSVVTWLTDSTFIMPNEDIIIGMEVMKPHEIPFYEGFENGNTSGQPVVGWLQQFESEATSYWGAYNNDSTYNRAPYSGSWNASLFKQYYSSYDNVTSWLFTPVNLEKGKNYMFSIYARQYKGSTILGCTAEITVKLGTAAPNKDSMKQVVTMSNTCIRRSDNYQRLVGYVIADTSGACWLGIRGSLTDADGVLCLSIDSISLVEAETRTITIVESEYGTISAIQKAEYGDTITVSPIMNSDTVRFAGYTTTPKLTWVNDSTFIMPDEDVTIGMEIYKRHTIVASASEYGIIAIRKDTALCGDTITVSHTVNEVLMGDSLRFAGYTTTPNLTWVNDSTFIMPDEDVIIGVEIYKKHTIVASASEYGIIAIRKDTAFCGDTIPVSHTMNSGFVFVNYTTTAAVTWLTDSTFIMPNENVTVGMEVMKVNEIPFYEGFENNSTQGQQVVGWLHECGYIWFSWTANSTETEYNRTPYSGSWNATLSSGNLSWIFTPVNLVKGTKYVFCIYARQDKRYYWHVNISAKIGMAPNRGSMKQNVLSETDVTNGDYQRIESSFVADTSGVCWLGIKGNVGSIANYLSIDSISLVAIEGWHAITAEDEYGTFNIESGAVKDETVIVKHTMKPGYAFTGYVTAPEVKWTSDTTFIMPDEEVVITMTATKIDCAITIADTENGTVKSSDATAQIDDIVKLTITPSVGYTLDEITILQNGNMTTFNAEDSTFVMSGGDVEISATFRKVDYTILVHESENGAVIAFATAQMDDAVKLTITPAVGYTLDEITILQNGDMVTFNAEDSTFVMPADSVEISATFRKDDYAILVHESENGMVTSNVTAQMDDVVKLAITPAVGYTLDEITISQNGDKVAFNAEDSTFIMPAGDVEISVTFTKIDYSISIGESENGSVVSNKATAQIGDTVKLTITSAVGYTIDEITISQTGDKVAFNAEDSTFVMSGGNVEISATFKKIDYNITIGESENGSVSTKATAQKGEWVELAITPEPGYVLDEITILHNGGKVAFNAKYSIFVMPAGDVTISATFKQSTIVEDVKILNLYVADGRIYCEGEFRIYDLLGRDVTAMNGSLYGVYIVRTKDASRKVIVE